MTLAERLLAFAQAVAADVKALTANKADASHTHAYSAITGTPTLGTAAAKNISIGTTAPASPAENDLWVDTN